MKLNVGGNGKIQETPFILIKEPRKTVYATRAFINNYAQKE